MNVRLLHETLLASAERVPEREAVVAGAERLAYAELLDRTLRLARALQELGVGRGDRVAIFMDNSAGCATSWRPPGSSARTSKTRRRPISTPTSKSKTP